MIASFKLLLPYVFQVLTPDELIPYHTTVNHCEVTLYPPLGAKVETASFGGEKQIALLLLPAIPQVPTDRVKVNNQNTVDADLKSVED